jgi:hypothetical protein
MGRRKKGQNRVKQIVIRIGERAEFFDLCNEELMNRRGAVPRAWSLRPAALAFLESMNFSSSRDHAAGSHADMGLELGDGEPDAFDLGGANHSSAMSGSGSVSSSSPGICELPDRLDSDGPWSDSSELEDAFFFCVD